MNIFKRIIAVALAGTMLVSVCPTSVFADDSGQEEITDEAAANLYDDEAAGEAAESLIEDETLECLPETVSEHSESYDIEYEMIENPPLAESEDTDIEIVEDGTAPEEDGNEEACIESEEEASSTEENETIPDGFTIQDVVDVVVRDNEEAEQKETRIISVKLQDDYAIVTYMAQTDASIYVYLSDEDDAEGKPVAEGRIEVTAASGEEEAMEVQVPLTLIEGEEMPSAFIIAAEITDSEGEVFRFLSDEYTRLRQGIEAQGFAFLTDYAAGSSLYGTADNYVLYSENVVVVSAEETEAISINQTGNTYTIKPAPTAIRNMTEDAAGKISGIVFIKTNGEHEIVKITQGSLLLAEEDGVPVVSFEAEKIDTESADLEDFKGIYSAIHLSSIADDNMSLDIDDAFVAGHIDLSVTGTSMLDVTYALIDMIYKFDYHVQYSADSQLQVKQSMTQTKPESFNDALFESYYQEIAQKYLIGTFNFTSDRDGTFAKKIHYHINFTANVASSGPVDTVFENNGMMDLSMASDHWFDSSKGAKVNTSTVYSKLEPTGNDSQTDFYFAITTEVKTDKVGDLSGLNGATSHASKVIYYKNTHEDSYNGKEVKHYCGIADEGYCVSYGIADKASLNLTIEIGELSGSISKTFDNDGLIKYVYNTTYNPEYNQVHFYYSDNKFIWCPFIAQKIDVHVSDEEGNPQGNTFIDIPREEVQHVKDLFGENAPLFVSGFTGEDGSKNLYLPSGNYIVRADYPYSEQSGYENHKEITVENDPLTVIFGKAPDQIEKLHVRNYFPKYADIYLKNYVPVVYPVDSMVDTSLEFKWLDTYDNVIDTTIEGYQYLYLDCQITNDQQAGLFADNLEVEIEDECVPSPFSFNNYELYSLKVDSDRKTAHIIIRVQTFKKDTDIHEVEVINGWGSGHYAAGSPVHVISWDASLNDIAEVYGEAEAQRI